MPVNDTLNKIVERHPDVIGAMVLSDGQVHHNFEAPYDVISVELILETLSEIFENTAMLEDEGYNASEVIIDFVNHSLIVRTIENGVLAALAPRFHRGELVKLQVGLGIFAKAVQMALAEAPEVAETAPTDPETGVAEEPPQSVVEDQVSYEAAPDPDIEPDIENVDASDLNIPGLPKRNKRGGYRRTKDMLAGRLMHVGEAVSDPQPKEDSAEENVEEDVPLNEDATPKTMKMYRGQIYYE